MLVLLLFTLLASPTNGEVKNEIANNGDGFLDLVGKFLPACIKDSTCKMIADTVELGSKQYGIKKNLILALIKKETNGRHIPGKGEWGMLQVVPWEDHILRLVKYYKCLPKEKHCRCPLRGKCTHKTPIAYSLTRRGKAKGGRLATRFLKANPRAALYIGIGEMAYYKERYKRFYRYRFWGHWRKIQHSYPRFPKRYLKHKLKDMYSERSGKYFARTQSWWYRVRKLLGNDVWVVHHNYGAQIRLDKIGRTYPIVVAKYLKQLKKLTKEH